MLQASQLLSTVLNRANVANQKQLELTPGQVVKGTVLKLFPENMALVQIGGMQIHAKLETNLEAGQQAWLQVQPSSDPLSLKVVSNPENPNEAQETTIEGLMRSLGITDTREARAIVQALIKQHMPIHKEMVAAFVELAKNQEVTDDLIKSFLLAWKRDLPLTKDVVTAIKAFLTDQPIAKTVQNFVKEAESFLSQEKTTEKNPILSQNLNVSQVKANPPMQQVVSLLKEKITGLFMTATEDGLSLSASHARITDAISISSETQKTSPAAPAVIQADTSTEEKNLSLSSNQKIQNQAQLQNTSNPTPQPSTEGQNQTQATVKPNGKSLISQSQFHDVKVESNLESEISTPKNLTNATKTFDVAQKQTREAVTKAPVNINSIEQTTYTEMIEGDQQSTVFSKQEKLDPAVNLPTEKPSTIMNQSVPSENDKGNVIKELFRQLGLMHERTISHQGGASGAHVSVSLNETELTSVKSLLLQVVQSPSNQIPSGLREAADTLLQQVTGQQLMLTQPTNQAFSQIVMQLPLRTEQSEETAFIQIESKKKEGGQLDPENCRLFFNLDLKQMGITMVDVSIVNRIINVGIFNDIPKLDRVVINLKEVFANQLRDVGYHLSNLRVQQIPSKKNMSANLSSIGNLMSDYKGVDIRI